MTLNTEHFSRWAGDESQAIGLSPNPIYLFRRASLKSKEQSKKESAMILSKLKQAGGKRANSLSQPAGKYQTIINQRRQTATQQPKDID